MPRALRKWLDDCYDPCKAASNERATEKQETDDFKVKYRQRSGIESTNSLLKRVTGLGRLRVRGKASVFHSLLLKVAGWNILRAASSKRLMASLKGLLAALISLVHHLENRQRMQAFHLH